MFCPGFSSLVQTDSSETAPKQTTRTSRNGVNILPLCDGPARSPGSARRQVGVVLGSYQASRAFANTLIGLFGSKTGPGLLYPIMVASSVAGYFLAAQLADVGVWGMLAFLAVGFSEVVVPLQVRHNSPVPH